MVKLPHPIPPEFLGAEPRTLVVSAKTKKHWAVMIDLLQELDRVCQKNGLHYHIDGGTLLGAVRHGGFIPWDDDVDVVMLRGDYEKLKSIAASEFAQPYFFQTNDTDREWFQSYARLCNDDTAAIAKVCMINGKTTRLNHQGIFIDIFPLDKLPNDDQDRADYLYALSIALSVMANRSRALLTFRRPKKRIFLEPMMLISYIKGAWIAFLQKLFKKDLIREAYLYVHELGTKYETCVCEECGESTFLPGLCETIRFPVANYTNADKRMTFEWFKAPVPCNPERYLELMFGNWREHVVGTGLHGALVVDVDRSYREYLIT